MDPPPPQPTPRGEKPRVRLAAFLRERREKVLERWERAERELPCARGLTHLELIDHLPALIEQVAATADRGPAALLDRGGDPEAHALERLQKSFTLTEVIAEYALLRQCVVEVLEAEGLDLSSAELVLFNQAIDRAIARSVDYYTGAHGRALAALEAIAVAAVEAPDLDALLPALLRVLLEQVPVVDCAAIFLQEDGRSRPRAELGTEPGLLAAMEKLAGRLSESRETVFLDHASLVAEGGWPPSVLSVLGHPLVVGREPIGVLVMGSHEATRFSEVERLAFRLISSRAASLISRAQLVSRERAALTEAEEQRALARLIIDQSGEGIVVADERGVIRVFNPEAERQHGAGLAEVPPEQWAGAFGLRTREGPPLVVQDIPLFRALHGELVRDAKWVVVRPNGQRRVLAGTAAPLTHPDGSSAGAVLVTRDETERLALEDERARLLEREREAKAAAQRAAAELEALLRAAPAGVAFLDRGLRFLHANEVMASLHRRTSAELVGKATEEVGSMLGPSCRHVLDTGESVAAEHRTHADDGPRWWLSYYFPVVTPDEMVGAGCVMVDITQQKRAEEELRRAASFREQFIGVLGHDLRNPLTAIITSTQLLLRQGALEERQRRALARIGSSAEKMSKLIDDILDFTRGRLGGGFPVTRKPMELHAVARQAIDELQVAYPDRQVELREEGSGWGEWDAGRIGQLVSNLVGNALQHGSAEAPVRVTIRDEGPEVALSVWNPGKPIPPEQLARLFEPFQQPEGRSRGRGLGLGLYISAQIVRAHEGTIEAHSSVEEGITFCVRLPRRAAVEASAALRTGGETPATPS